MDFMIVLVGQSLEKVWVTFTHNWPFLAASIVLAAVLKTALDPEKISAFLRRHSGAGVAGATAVAVATPLCSCGTMAIILGMMANTMPWAPIVAFMVASPLTSPQELVYSAGLFGWPFALAFFTASILLGLAGGWFASLLERRGWLKNQSRFSATKPAEIPEPSCGCESAAYTPKKEAHREPERGCGCSTSSPFVPLETGPVSLAAGCGCGAVAVAPAASCCDSGITNGQAMDAQTTTGEETPRFWKGKSIPLAGEMWTVAIQLIPMFFLFAFVGYLLNGLIPQDWVSALFGGGNVYSVPLAATLGLPFYINTEASLPMVRALIDGGMSQGAALAFLITGAGTSIGAFTGALTIARWRVVGTVVGTLWLGSILLGYLFNILLA